MGVLGLTPFLHRHCPEVIKTLPGRLQALRGKTVIIDGTLVTQRLHWAPVSHKYRHVLGWYRLVTELKENGVKAVCVFDGKERSAAKALELERRRRERTVAATRGTIEVQRLDRLRRLTTLMNAVNLLSARDRDEASIRIKALVDKLAPGTDVQRKSEERVHQKSLVYPAKIAQEAWSGLEDTAGFDEEIDGVDGDNVRAHPRPNIHAVDLADDLSDEDVSFATSFVLPEEADADVAWWQHYNPLKTPDLNELLQHFSDLYHEFRRVSHPIAHAKAVGDVNESKLQHALTVDEEELWQSVAMRVSPSVLSTLVERSSLLAESYQRRGMPPTSETYAESQGILKAMGVPVVQSTGPYEAEGLAVSLANRGYGDFVATEDTDVLVYGARMLRNLTNRSGPLVEISSCEVYEALQLSHDSFIDFALLLGTDFSRRIKNVGPSRALKFIRIHGTIEDIIANEPQYPPVEANQSSYLEQIAQARTVFRSLPPVPVDLDLTEREGDQSEVSALLLRYGLGRFITDDREWDYGAALTGNYFNDNPAFS